MSDVEQDPPRPTPLSSGGNPAPPPRLLPRPLPTPPDPAPPADEAAAAEREPAPAEVAPPQAAAPARTLAPRVERPGEVIFSATRLSLQRLFKLEQDVSKLPGAGRASVDILDDGQIVIHVAPGAEERVRQYLALIEIER